ncbi:MAG TPA: hypothetical protein VEI74_05835 [Candidatus Methylomirabilis sp.]|nr:hypothetical protein [Candidatus Methylomirabilis sp.]
MLHWFRKKLKPHGRGVLAAIASLWLVAAAAPCVMAQPHPMDHASSHCPMHQGAMSMDASDCGPITSVNCQLPDVNTPLAAALDHAIATPALLTVLPVSFILPNTGQQPQRIHLTPDIPAPPFHIRHLTLIL